jgi:tocopherol cyclase
VADERNLRVDLGDDAQLSVQLDDTFGWPRRPLHGGGLASVVPFLNQYWHPHVLGGTVRGTVRIGDQEHSLDGATVYCEKNWGAGFPPVWWWGQAQGFPDRPDVCVAFSGGHLAMGPVGIKVSGVVVRVADEVIRLAPPTALVGGGHDRDAGRWWVRGRNGVWSVLVEGDANGTEPHVLPVPLPAEGRNVFTDFEHLAGRLRVVVRRRGQLVYEGTSDLAGLEHGHSPTP